MYVNTYIIPVPESMKSRYIELAKKYVEIVQDFGALQMYENWEAEVPDGEQTDYRKAVKAKPGEKIVIAWIVWPDRETAAKAHKDLFADPRVAELGDMPFDADRMILGGFDPILTFDKNNA